MGDVEGYHYVKINPVDIITSSFDSKAGTWDDDPQKILRAKKVANLIRPLLPKGDVLKGMEYGCGTGLLSFELANDIGSVCLADTSVGMLDVLQEKISATGISNFSAVLLDLTNTLGESSRQLDVIYSLMTLHHIADTAAILGQFFYHLRPGGKLLLADLDQEDGSFHPEGTTGIHYGFERGELTRAAKSAGFDAINFYDAFVIAKNNRNYPVFLFEATKVVQ